MIVCQKAAKATPRGSQPGEVAEFFAASRRLNDRALLMTLYGAGHPLIGQLEHAPQAGLDRDQCPDVKQQAMQSVFGS